MFWRRPIYRLRHVQIVILLRSMMHFFFFICSDCVTWQNSKRDLPQRSVSITSGNIASLWMSRIWEKTEVSLLSHKCLYAGWNAPVADVYEDDLIARDARTVWVRDTLTKVSYTLLITFTRLTGRCRAEWKNISKGVALTGMHVGYGLYVSIFLMTFCIKLGMFLHI